MPTFELKITFPPVPPLDSAGAPSHAISWNVYVNDMITPAITGVAVGTVDVNHPTVEFGTDDVAVSLVNELGEGALSPITTLAHEQPLGVPSMPNAPGVELIVIP